VLIGAHVSSAGGPAAAIGRGDAMGAEAVQIFTQSPRAWRPSPLSDEDAESTRAALGGAEFTRALFCHGTYLMNLASPDSELRQRSLTCFAHNYRAASALGSQGLIFHPGSHRGSGIETAIARIADGVVEGVAEVAAERGEEVELAPVLFENTAGAGDTVGKTFEDLAALIEATSARLESDLRSRVALAVCIDTQHLWASGVDFASIERADRVVADLKAVVGAASVLALHLNDSKVPLGQERDRHANLGEGSIGIDGLAALVGHPDLQHAAVLLEVPGPHGKGPEAVDVVRARELHARGLWMRSGEV
jgi:deoxyribonuclease-4